MGTVKDDEKVSLAKGFLGGSQTTSLYNIYNIKASNHPVV
jgi:hypothetical protein